MPHQIYIPPPSGAQKDFLALDTKQLYGKHHASNSQPCRDVFSILVSNTMLCTKIDKKKGNSLRLRSMSLTADSAWFLKDVFNKPNATAYVAHAIVSERVHQSMYTPLLVQNQDQLQPISRMVQAECSLRYSES
jgi:hypothetical protein